MKDDERERAKLRTAKRMGHSAGWRKRDKETGFGLQPTPSEQSEPGSLLSEAPKVTLLVGDVMAKLKELPDESVQCCITSPPYWALRDYSRCDCSFKGAVGGGLRGPEWDGSIRGESTGSRAPDPRNEKEPDPSCPKCKGLGKIEEVANAQIGLEKSVEEWVAKLVGVFREVKRVLRKDGTLWLNLGDSYAANGGWADNAGLDGVARGTADRGRTGNRRVSPGLKPKDLIGQPWALAFALRVDGWWLRSAITWCKRSPMPESTNDRPTSATEMIFLLTKNERYYYDNMGFREDAQNWGERESAQGKFTTEQGAPGQAPHAGLKDGDFSKRGRNARNFWVLGPEPFPLAHFATYPSEIPRRAILLGTSAKGACGKCHAPWERVTSVSRSFESGSGKSGKDPIGKNGAKLQGGGATRDVRRGPVITTSTTGWAPTCTCFGSFVKRKVKRIKFGDWSEEPESDCGVDWNVPPKKKDLKPVEVEEEALVYEPTIPLEEHPIVPNVVLDPFGGSGTTGAVARRLGRSAILIELNPNYAALIRKRCALDQRSLEEAAVPKPKVKEEAPA